MRIVILFTLCVGCALFSPAQSLGCLCKSEPVSKTIKRLRKESNAIFVGTVKAVAKDEMGYKATFIVEKTWKSIPVKEATIQTKGGCMAWFETGRSYLVYAAKDSADKLTTNVCMRTRLIKYASQDLKLLGEPKQSTQNLKVDGSHRVRF